MRETGFSFSQYTNSLLCFYVLLMLLAFSILSQYYSFFDSVCLTFLVVFINSYYWESMFHLNAIVFYGLSFNQFIQAFHLIPTYYLYKKLEIQDRMFYKLLVLGLIISDLNLLAYNFIPRFYFYSIPINQRLFNNITRFLCLSILISALTRHTIIKKKGI